MGGKLGQKLPRGTKRNILEEKIAAHHSSNLLWPRQIADGFDKGKSMQWVDEQCEKYGEASRSVRQWVDIYINMGEDNGSDKN